MKSGSQSAAIHRKERKERQAERAEEKRLRREEKAREKQEREAQEEVKDVSDFTEIPIPESEKPDSAIPIYGHNDKEKQQAASAQTPEPSSENNVTEVPRKRPKRQLVEEDNSEETSKEDMSSISDAGEVENTAYKLPPLSLLNTPAKQRLLQEQRCKRKVDY